MLVHQYLSSPGSQLNQDLIAFNGDCAVLLDGATPLDAQRASVDVRQYIRNFAEALLSNREDSALPALLRTVITSLREHYRAASGVDPQSVAVNVSAAGSIVREHGGTTEVFCVGDCAALVFFQNGRTEICCRDDLTRLDNAVIARMKAIRRVRGGNICDIVKLPEIRAMLLYNRSLMNTADGYQAFSFDADTADKGLYRRFPTAALKKIILYSDGFSAVSERFFENEIDFEELCRYLRSQERADPTCNSRLRFKESDDASALEIYFQGIERTER